MQNGSDPSRQRADEVAVARLEDVEWQHLIGKEDDAERKQRQVVEASHSQDGTVTTSAAPAAPLRA